MDYKLNQMNYKQNKMNNKQNKMNYKQNKMSNNLIGVDKMIMKVRMSLYLNKRVKKIIIKN